MTIGIAAYGPHAGRAVFRALQSVEAVARGAIGGFVSFVAITAAGTVGRCDTQRGGTAALFPDGRIPEALGEAPLAGLMSSGPDRPEPLSQFTPADGGVGLVTGHRMPNTVGVNGVNLNDEVLDLMRRGHAPADAIAAVIRANPDGDAGIIALSVDGRLHAADAPAVLRRGDAGRALVGSAAQGAAVAVLHNAIHPHRPIAVLAAEVAMDAMRPADNADGWILFRQGTRVVRGTANAVSVGADGMVEAIHVENPKFLAGKWSFGIGYEARVVGGAAGVAAMLYEPYMILEDGRLAAIDGRSELAVPIRMG